MKHSWDKPYRETYRTTRTCTKCGMQMVTRHDGPMPWIEFWLDNAQIKSKTRPPCQPEKANQ